jgi:hypothetical protein
MKNRLIALGLLFVVLALLAVTLVVPILNGNTSEESQEEIDYADQMNQLPVQETAPDSKEEFDARHPAYLHALAIAQTLGAEIEITWCDDVVGNNQIEWKPVDIFWVQCYYSNAMARKNKVFESDVFVLWGVPNEDLEIGMKFYLSSGKTYEDADFNSCGIPQDATLIERISEES